MSDAQQQIRIDIGRAADFVWHAADQLYGDFGRNPTRDQWSRFLHTVKGMILDAARLWNVSPTSVRYELNRRQVEVMIGSLPRKIAKRC